VSHTVSTSRRPGRQLVLLLAALWLAGCVVNEQRPMERIAAERATIEVPEDELLEVGVRLFDPNVPQDPETSRSSASFPDVRKAESRYIPLMIRDTLEDTGQWGQVRVLPRDGTGMDVFVDGSILESNGQTCGSRSRSPTRPGASGSPAPTRAGRTRAATGTGSSSRAIRSRTSTTRSRTTAGGPPRPRA